MYIVGRLFVGRPVKRLFNFNWVFLTPTWSFIIGRTFLGLLNDITAWIFFFAVSFDFVNTLSLKTSIFLCAHKEFDAVPSKLIFLVLVSNRILPNFGSLKSLCRFLQINQCILRFLSYLTKVIVTWFQNLIFPFGIKLSTGASTKGICIPMLCFQKVLNSHVVHAQDSNRLASWPSGFMKFKSHFSKLWSVLI